MEKGPLRNFDAHIISSRLPYHGDHNVISSRFKTLYDVDVTSKLPIPIYAEIKQKFQVPARSRTISRELAGDASNFISCIYAECGLSYL